VLLQRAEVPEIALATISVRPSTAERLLLDYSVVMFVTSSHTRRGLQRCTSSDATESECAHRQQRL